MEQNPLEKKYNSIYSGTDTAFGAGNPEEFVEKIISYIKTGKVLELGAGQGRNSVWLAKNGFDVEAWDISSVGIDKTNELSKNEKLNILALKKDSREEINSIYDVIVSTFMFHHLTMVDSLNILKNIKNHTRPGGLNVVTAFTKQGDFFEKDKNTPNFFPELGEMKDIYKDWEILEYDEINSKARATKEDGSPMFNISARIIARKP
jgi:tellurite methyltransferase